MKEGRPTIYTQELSDRICSDIAQGMSLRTLCRPDDMPCTATIFNWFRSHPEFLEQYTRAKEEQAEALVEEILDIADDGSNDWMEKFNSDGNSVGWVLNGEHVNRSRLRIDSRKWLASKLKPKRYADKMINQNTNQTLDKDGNPIDDPITAMLKFVEQNNTGKLK